MQMKKMFGIALAAALVGSMAVVAMPVSAIEYDGEEHTLGIVGDFTNWGGNDADGNPTPDVAMTDPDGDGVYEGAYIHTGDAGEFEFKVRADSAWTTSWGAYEFNADQAIDRTQNSQTNLKVSLEAGKKLIVKLDTTKVDPLALANAESYVNTDAFDFEYRWRFH